VSDAFSSIDAGHAPLSGHDDPMMHITNTVDYIIVLQGEIYAVMDQGETLLRPGDVLIQRGTNHSWHNRSDEPCVIAAVLVSADPAR
jgi:quercetin dioxygenase-like cupin family protein